MPDREVRNWSSNMTRKDLGYTFSERWGLFDPDREPDDPFKLQRRWIAIAGGLCLLAAVASAKFTGHDTKKPTSTTVPTEVSTTLPQDFDRCKRMAAEVAKLHPVQGQIDAKACEEQQKQSGGVPLPGPDRSPGTQGSLLTTPQS